MTAGALQSSLFPAGPQGLVEDDEGGVFYRPGVVDLDTAQRWFEGLREAVAWQAMRRPMYERLVDVPRLVCAYRLESDALPEPLPEIAECVCCALAQPFNTVGLNLYRDGRDSVAPHNDKLETLVPGRPIAVLSLGATRRMTVRAKRPPRTPIHVDLEAGSIIVMSHASQLHFDHGIPKSRGAVGPRISLAFRVRPAGHRSRLYDHTLPPPLPSR